MTIEQQLQKDRELVEDWRVRFAWFTDLLEDEGFILPDMKEWIDQLLEAQKRIAVAEVGDTMKMANKIAELGLADWEKIKEELYLVSEDQDSLVFKEYRLLEYITGLLEAKDKEIEEAKKAQEGFRTLLCDSCNDVCGYWKPDNIDVQEGGSVTCICEHCNNAEQRN